MRKPQKRWLTMLTALLLAGALLGGCTYKSGPKTLAPEDKPPAVKPMPEAGQVLAGSLEKTVREGRRFWFQGWISSKIQKRKTNSMSEGTFDRDKGFIIKASLLQKQYSYYRWADRVYVSKGEMWRRAGSNEAPPDPFAGFEKLAAAADRAGQLPEEKVMGQPCQVLQVTLSGAEIKQLVPPGVKLPESRTASAQLAKARLQYTIWISKNDRFIYQYKARLTMPVPGAGALVQETFFRFADYNSPSVQLTRPEKVERYLVED